MTERRDFLKTGVAALGGRAEMPSHLALMEARELVRRGTLGRIEFCRVHHARLIPAVRQMLGSACVVEIEPSAVGATILGSHATLAITSAGCRVYPRQA